MSLSYLNKPVRLLWVFVCACFLNLALLAQDDDQTGIKIFRSATTNLSGSGVRVAQIEADDGEAVGAQDFEVNPAAVGFPAGKLSYQSSAGSGSVYPNQLGVDSYHSDRVAQFFYGTVSPGQTANGVATNVAHVDVVDAKYFLWNQLANLESMNDSVFCQSYSFGAVPVITQQAWDSFFDDYTAQFGALFVSAIGANGVTPPPGTAYNSIGVGAYGPGSSSATGPTPDNGRCKPDITAPDANTSFSAPQVAGAAAVLVQAGWRGDGGPGTNAATDPRTLKALLLNGAVKPLGWTNSAKTPLDARYGSGMLNLYNSYRELAGGRQTNFVVSTVAAMGIHPPTTATNTIGALSGWDFNTNNSSSSADTINHYCFNITNSVGPGNFLAAVTLVWNRQLGGDDINHLQLYLFNTANSNLVACSTSAVDNVQHLWLTHLAPGRDDLQVWKAGGPGIVSTGEPYALAFAFMPQPMLTLHSTGKDLALTWPAYPAGFAPEAATGMFGSGNWSTNGLLPITLNNQQNQVVVCCTNLAQGYRLCSPNF